MIVIFHKKKRIKSLLKKIDLLPFILYNNQNTSFSVKIYLNIIKTSILKTWILKRSLFHFKKINNLLYKISFQPSFFSSSFFLVKFNNKFYNLNIIKTGFYLLNYYLSVRIIYKFLTFLLKKFNRNNVN